MRRRCPLWTTAYKVTRMLIHCNQIFTMGLIMCCTLCPLSVVRPPVRPFHTGPCMPITRGRKAVESSELMRVTFPKSHVTLSLLLSFIFLSFYPFTYFCRRLFVPSFFFSSFPLMSLRQVALPISTTEALLSPTLSY